MREYRFQVPPGVANIDAISGKRAMSLGLNALESQGIEAKLKLEALIHFIAVFTYKETYSELGEMDTGWLCGGNMPHLALNAEEIQTPIEALAIYALYLRPWLAAKGIDDPEGSIPVYRVPPDWKPLTFDDGYEAWRMGAITSYIEWNIIADNADEILHPEIREDCIRRGWINLKK